MLVAIFAITVGVTLWFVLEPKAEREDPNFLVNLTKMVGQPAPSFQLADSEGQAVNITPGDGRKYVLIFHMGSI